MEALIRTGLAQLGQAEHVPQNAPALLARYGQLLLEQHQVMNLTAITDPAGVASLHMLDCAALLGCAQLEGKSLIDVGTGAGFPGMALKILVPSLDLTLLDSLKKRLDFLQAVCEDLSIRGFHTIHSRAEELGHEAEFREQYDFATARAVADLRLLCELCLPLVKAGGRFLAMKGPDCDGEIQDALPAIALLGGRVERRFDYDVPYTQARHRVVVVEKISPTPEKYPRRWAKMQKNPL